MHLLFRCLPLIAALALTACAEPDSSSGDGASGGSSEVRTGPFRALIYSRTAGFRHASIEPGIFAIQQLAAENDFTVDATEDPAQFNAANLAQYEVVIFLNTTLDVLDDAQQAAFEGYIRRGGNFVGIHSAADTEHDWPFYNELVGAHFMSHPVLNQPGTLRVEDPQHPSTAHLPAPWQVPFEEYYSFSSNTRGAVRVLLSIDEDSYTQEPNTSCDPRGPTFPEGFNGRMGDHPMSWCHDKFAGRAWYTALGHEIYLYFMPEYRQHILNGILTAARRVPASCAVNARPAGVPEYAPPVLEPCENQLSP